MKNKSRYLILLTTIFHPVIANALSLDYSVEGGIQSSDNVNRSENSPVSDEILTLSGEITVRDTSSRNDLDLSLNLRRLQYNNRTDFNDTLANIDLTSRWGIVKDVFLWQLDEFYGQQTVDSSAVATPENRQDVSVFTTGPELVVRYTSLDSLRLSYRYTNFYTEVSDADYQSNLIRASLARRISPNISLALNSSYEDISYDDELSNDFEETRYSLSISGAYVTTQYNIELGQIDLEFQDGTKADSLFKLFGLTRRLNSNNNISLSLLDTVDTSARLLARTTGNSIISNDVFVNEQAQLGYGYNKGGFQLSLSHAYSEQDYINNDNLDRVERTSIVNVGTELPMLMRLSMDYRYENNDFYNTGQEVKEDTLTLRLEKRLTREFSGVVSYEYFNRKSSIPPNDIEENTIMLTLRYADRI